MSRLALFGGTPVVRMDEFDTTWPIVTDGDIQVVTDVLRRGAFTSLSRHEEHVAALEEEYARYVGSAAGVAVANGTAALHLALTAGGVGPGDEVIVPAFTFMASALAVLHAQAVPVFADVGARTFNLNARRVEERITPRTRAILCVHLHGLPADMAELRAIADRRGLLLIEDAAQAHGAEYRGRRVGSLGDVAATSFHVSKNLPTCGEGGMITTDRPDVARRARLLRQFGDALRPDGQLAHVAQLAGWNYKMNVIQAAFVRNKLPGLPADTAARQRNLTEFSRRLAQLPGVICPEVPDDRTHAFHFFRFRLDPRPAGFDLPPGKFRRAVHRALLAEGAFARQYQVLPLPAHPVFRSAAVQRDEYPVTRAILEDSLTLQRGVIRPDAAPLLDRYFDAFSKVWEHLDDVVREAQTSRGASADAERVVAAAGVERE